MPGFKFAYEKALRGRNLKDGEYKVLTTLLTYADADGKNAHPGVETLANACNMVERTVRTHLKALCDMGYVVQVARGRGGSKHRSVYDFVMPEAPAKAQVPATEVPANSRRSTGKSEQSTGKFTSQKPPLNSRNEPLSGPVSGPKSDPLFRTVDAKEEMPLLDEMTTEFLDAYPKSGNVTRVKNALAKEMNAHGGARHFAVLLASAKAYADRVRADGTEQKWVKAPHNFIADGTYKTVRPVQTHEDRCRIAWEKADLKFLGIPYSQYDEYTDDIMAATDSVGDSPKFDSDDERERWQFGNRQRFIAYWIKKRLGVNVHAAQSETTSVGGSLPF